MRKAKEILRLRWQQERSFREIAKVLDVGLGTASEVVSRATRIGITSWAEVEASDEAELEARLYPLALTAAVRPEPSPAAMHLELRRTGVTLRLLHEEYVLAHPNASPYGYTERVNEFETAGMSILCRDGVGDGRWARHALDVVA